MVRPTAGSDDETHADSDDTADLPQPVPVLVVLGDARKLGARRAVLRIEESLEIGRRPQAVADRAWVLDDARVSRRHAVVEANILTGLRIVDLGSRNGTIVNGRTLSEGSHALTPGSMIFIGTHAAVFRFATEADLDAIAQDLLNPFTPVATTSPGLARLTRLLRQLAKGDQDLLLLGETGVGKEEYARAIHRHSGREGKFIAINCAALPGSLVESELFGYARGAHSQASRDKPGLVDEAEHGTLFLDEFAELPPEVQAKLLRFLEDRDLMPLGSTKRRRVDVRILAATNRGLDAIRTDIAARLGPEPIRLPPLRKHPEDIAALASHFLGERADLGLELPAFHALCLHDWPDNVRGLKKALGRAVELAAADAPRAIALAQLPEGLGRKPTPPDSPIAEPAAEVLRPTARRSPRSAPSKEELEALLERNDWVVAQAARDIDRDHAVVWRWIKRYGLDVGHSGPDRR